MTTTTQKKPLTDRQRDVFDWIEGYINVHGFSPTVRQIGSHYGFTPNGVKTHLNALRRKGWVTWQDGCSRTLRVIGGDA